MFKNRINIVEILKRKPFLLVVVSLIFASFIALIDALVDYFFYYEESLFEVLLPSFESHEFYMRMMLIMTVTLFGFMITLLLKSNLKYEEKIKDSEFSFKTVANFTKDWEYWITPENKINFISPSCLEITGYTTEEFIASPNLIHSLIIKEDIEEYLKHENCSISDDKIDPLEFRIRKKDGEVIWIGHTCRAVYSENGKYLGQRGSNRDISVQKSVEKELRETSKKLEESNKILKREVDFSYLELEALFSQSPYAKAIFDKNGKTIKVNEAWHNLFQMETHLDNILELTNLPNKELISKAKRVLKKGGAFKSNPIYFEEFDKMLQLDIYSINNPNGETEKIVCNYEDVTDQIRILDSNQELELQRTVSKKLFEFLEAERKHISKELHDQIGQKLMLIKLNMEVLRENSPKICGNIDEVIKLLLSTNKEIKDIIYSLHPAELENYGLVSALDTMINQCSGIGNFKASINIYGKYSPLEKSTELAIYRICQEIVSNIAKHSKATEANFEFDFEEKVFVGVISDNGVGFNVNDFQKNSDAPRSFGLISVQERAKNLNGFLEYQSSVNKGTKIYFQIPLEEEINA